MTQEIRKEIKELIKELPIEIVRTIYSYGYIGHNIYMKNLCDQIDKTKVFRYNCHILFEDHVKHNQTPSFYTTSIPQYNSFALSEHVKINLFKQAIRCYCCNRHCNKRPNIKNINEQIHYNELYSDSYYESFVSNCGCYCRHIARSMKHALTTNNNDMFHSRLNELFKE
uniref:Uncharacterized protein n=1 Tax=viral metagenome TaxID=1070528 RepID=A0A6C0ETP5_9ZZZZ